MKKQNCPQASSELKNIWSQVCATSMKFSKISRNNTKFFRLFTDWSGGGEGYVLMSETTHQENEHEDGLASSW